MKLSAKLEYAMLAMLELAARQASGEPVRIREIAEAHGIPSRFLVQILLQLKNAGLVTSLRGAAGGYRISKSAQEISLADVVAAIEGIDQELGGNTAGGGPLVAALLAGWSEVRQARQQSLERITLADLLERADRTGSPMYYI